ncbi:MAG: type II secretion system protein N [Rhodoferax sp.]|nr:type II secretion system protein N [Rhodoferax sp.]
MATRSAGLNTRWAISGAALGLLLGLLAFAPAAWLGAILASATNQQLQLSDARGTLWRGDAQLVLSGGPGSQDLLALPGRLEWELSPALRGLQLSVRAACCTPQPLQLTLQPGWKRFQLLVADGMSEWPAGLLAGLGAPWNTVQPQGLLQLRSEHLSVEWVDGRISVAGGARLDALGMSSSLSTLRPVGSYRLSLAGSANRAPPTLQLQTLEGSLSLVGSGQWTGAHWSFRGEASAAPEREQALGNLLNMVGRRQGVRSVISLG